MIRFACPHCKAPLQIQENQAGTTVLCGRCRRPAFVPVKAAPPLLPLLAATLALVLGLAAFPLCVLLHPAVGGGAAALGILLAGYALVAALTQKAAGVRLALLDLAVCLSALFSSLLLGSGHQPLLAGGRPVADAPVDEPAGATAEPPGKLRKSATAAERALPGLGPPVRFRYEVDLWDLYGNNEAIADAKYTDKVVEGRVRGKVQKDESGRYFIAGQVSDLPGTTPGVYCYVAPADVVKLHSVAALQAFQVRGVCRGKQRDPTAWKGYSLKVEDCRVLAVLEWSAANSRWEVKD
jgi:hypothetical protein